MLGHFTFFLLDSMLKVLLLTQVGVISARNRDEVRGLVEHVLPAEVPPQLVHEGEEREAGAQDVHEGDAQGEEVLVAVEVRDLLGRVLVQQGQDEKA